MVIWLVTQKSNTATEKGYWSKTHTRKAHRKTHTRKAHRKKDHKPKKPYLLGRGEVYIKRKCVHQIIIIIKFTMCILQI